MKLHTERQYTLRQIFNQKPVPLALILDRTILLQHLFTDTVLSEVPRIGRLHTLPSQFIDHILVARSKIYLTGVFIERLHAVHIQYAVVPPETTDHIQGVLPHNRQSVFVLPHTRPKHQILRIQRRDSIIIGLGGQLVLSDKTSIQTISSHPSKRAQQTNVPSVSVDHEITNQLILPRPVALTTNLPHKSAFFIKFLQCRTLAIEHI